MECPWMMIACCLGLGSSFSSYQGRRRRSLILAEAVGICDDAEEKEISTACAFLLIAKKSHMYHLSQGWLSVTRL